MLSDCWNPAFATLPVMWLLHCLNQISACFPPVSMVSSHEVCLSSVCLGRETSGPRVPGADHLDQRQDYSDRRPPHRWQTWYPGWVRARLPLLTRITRIELWRNGIFVFPPKVWSPIRPGSTSFSPPATTSTCRHVHPRDAFSPGPTTGGEC